MRGCKEEFCRRNAKYMIDESDHVCESVKDIRASNS